MSANIPTLLALDFDGVLCNGLLEYFQVAWRTYCYIWSPATLTPPSDLAPRFYQLRPVIETGWEMPVLIRALEQGISADQIWQNWPLVAQEQLRADQLNAAEIGAKLDHLRDVWIETDLDAWLSFHEFYPGIVTRLQSLVTSPLQIAIVTTKEGRFVRQLLQKEGLALCDVLILGKESQRPKHQILREFLNSSSVAPTIWFVEDRLKTLQGVKTQGDLTNVRLFLADWGYNTPDERHLADQDERITLLSLSQFAQDFSAWS